MNKQNDNLNQAIEALRGMSIPQGPSDELVRQTLNQIEQTQNQMISPSIGKRRLIMKNTFKFAAAAVILIGVSLVFLFNSGPNTIALAAVYEKVLQAQAFMYEISMTMSGVGELTTGLPGGNAESNATVLISTDYGMKMENHVQVKVPGGTTQNITQLAYMLPNDKMIVSIMPEQKMYQKIELTGQLLEKNQKQNNDPREMIRQMMDCTYVSLGQSEINGVKVQGFETTDPAYGGGIGDVKAVLWVDVNTWLPVQSEVFATVGGKMKIETVISNFQWDVSVDPAEFAYVIPDDYKDAGSMKMPEMTEEAAVKGLDTYQKVFGGFPEKIDLASLILPATQRLARSEVSEAYKEKLEAAKAAGVEAMTAFSQEVVTPITSTGMFYLKLIQEKQDPIYYGQTVTPGDKSAVLLRWKTENGKYKVIFGDLSSAEMDYEELVGIEPAEKPAAESSSAGIGDPAAQAAQGAGFGQSAINIKKMLLACFMYAEKHNSQWPEALDQLTEHGIEPQTMINPARPDVPSGYVYVKPKAALSSPQIINTIVIYEAHETWGNGIYAGFADGHVEFVKDEADFLKRLSQE